MKTKNNTFKSDIGQAIMYQRFLRKISRRGLAEKCDMSPITIASIESGKGNYSIDNLITILDFFKIKLTNN